MNLGRVLLTELCLAGAEERCLLRLVRMQTRHQKVSLRESLRVPNKEASHGGKHVHHTRLDASCSRLTGVVQWLENK